MLFTQITLDIPQILKYGIVGLGALLAVLTYFLIAKEQSSKGDRPNLNKQIYYFMVFSLILIIIGAASETGKKYLDFTLLRTVSDSTVRQLSKSDIGDSLFLGDWRGSGVDLVNLGQTDTINGGYTYDFHFTFFINKQGQIRLSGTYTGKPKDALTPPLKPRNITGFCIRDGEFLRLIYDTHPQKNDRSRGFGLMMFQFLPSNEDAKGFYTSRSAKSGALVAGRFTLYKPENQK